MKPATAICRDGEQRAFRLAVEHMVGRQRAGQCGGASARKRAAAGEENGQCGAGMASPSASARALRSMKVPTQVMMLPASVVRFFAIQPAARSANAAMAESVMKHASKCTNTRFSVTVPLSVS